MKGFVQSYQMHTHDVAASHRIMKCLTPDKIPALTGLARSYAICDRWFSSVPGPTLPNRSFIHSATSIGRVDMSPIWLDEAETIYERLGKSGVSAKIYYHDWTMAMTFKSLLHSQNKFFGLFDDFERACGKNTLPSYCLIEPRYYDSDHGDNVFEADLGQNRDAVPLSLAMESERVAALGKLGSEQLLEGLVGELGLLQADDVGLAFIQPGQQSRHALLDRVHVPGSDAHRSER